MHVLPAPEPVLPASTELITEIERAVAVFAHHMKQYSLHLAYAELWKLINRTNAYFHAQEPWKLAKNNSAAFHEVLSMTCYALSWRCDTLLAAYAREYGKIACKFGR